MSLKFALCSDIDLEFRFKHMTSKKGFNYEEQQLDHLSVLIDKCIEQKVDALIIAGNLFGTPKPKNNTLKKVIELFNTLTNNGIYIFILPGVHDTPLYFSDDGPVHFVLKNMENIFILQSDDYAATIKRKIIDSVFKEKFKDHPIQIFTTTSPFIKPDELDLNLNLDKEYSNWFVLSDIYSFKKDIDNILLRFLEKLNDTDVDLLLIGGIIPNTIDVNQYTFQIINCPQIHQNNFDHLQQESESGLLVGTLENGRFSSFEKIIEVSQFHLIHEILNVNSIPPDIINDSALELIRNNTNQKNGLLKLTLNGKISKQDYHGIQIVDLNDAGYQRNYYFELSDLIEFEKDTEDISGLNNLTELELFTRFKISESKKDVSKSESEKKKEISLLEKALTKIKGDWRK